MTTPANANAEYKAEIKTIVGYDAQDNLNANVTLRTDTMQNLLDVTDAGDGEIAVANDRDVFVIYKGVAPSVGVPYSRGGDLVKFETKANIAQVDIPSDLAVTTGLFIEAVDDVDGLIDAATGTFSMIKINNEWPKTMTAIISLSKLGFGGTIRSVTLEREIFAGFFLPIAVTSFVPPQGTYDLQTCVISSQNIRLDSNLDNAKTLRFGITQDSGAAISNIGHDVSVSFEY